MANDNLKVTIGADASGLEKGLSDATNAIDKFAQKTKPAIAATNQAGNALTNLGRIASDAPFGFIAIQNNLDPLIQSFGSLSRASGGTGAALKALVGTLAGPAGLALGFTLVSSAITVAIQKYGSLGGAIDAIFGKFDPLNKTIQDAAKSYEKFNEAARTSEQIIRDEGASAEGTIQKVSALAAIVQDQTRSYQERNAALDQLKSINKEYFGNLDLEKGKIEGLTDAVNAYKQSLLLIAVQKGFEQEIGKTSVELQRQKDLLDQLRDRVDAANRAPVRIVGAAAQVDKRDIIDATNAFNAQNSVVKTLETQLQKLAQAQGKTVDDYTKLVAPINAANAAQKAADEQAKKSAAEATKNSAARSAAAKKAAAAQAELNANIRLAEELTRREQVLKTRLALPADPVATLNSFAEKLPPIPLTISPTIPAGVTEQFAKFAAAQKKALGAEQVQAVAAAFNDFLAPAIDAVFGAIESGGNIFKALGDSLKKLIVQLALTLAKAAALALILTLISGGGAGLAGFGSTFGKVLGGGIGGAGGGSGGLGALLSSGLFRGGNVTGGGLATESMGGAMISGQVVFTQRGSDLVGVLDRTNSRIGRVG